MTRTRMRATTLQRRRRSKLCDARFIAEFERTGNCVAGSVEVPLDTLCLGSGQNRVAAGHEIRTRDTGAGAGTRKAHGEVVNQRVLICGDEGQRKSTLKGGHAVKAPSGNQAACDAAGTG